jgi:hypothetical protein
MISNTNTSSGAIMKCFHGTVTASSVQATQPQWAPLRAHLNKAGWTRLHGIAPAIGSLLHHLESSSIAPVVQVVEAFLKGEQLDQRAIYTISTLCQRSGLSNVCSTLRNAAAADATLEMSPDLTNF